MSGIFESPSRDTLADGSVPVMLGKGTSGCVLSPQIPCMPGTEDPKGFGVGSVGSSVSKVFMSHESGVTEELMREEKRKMKYVKLMDPTSLFTIPFHGVCRADLSATALKRACALSEEMEVNEYQIVYGNGGADLFKIMSTSRMTFMELLPCFVSVMCGLVKMNSGSKRSEKFMHGDIKPGNITLGEDGHCKLIDFGFLESKKDVNESYCQFALEPYEYWPLEYDILKPGNESKPLLKKFVFDYLTSDIKEEVKSVNLGEYESFLARLPELYKFDAKYMSEFFIEKYLYLAMNFFDKFDVYSLGVTMLELYNSMNREGAGPEVLRFIRYLMHGNPNIRPTPDQALTAYLALFPKGELGDISAYLVLAGRDPAEYAFVRTGDVLPRPVEGLGLSTANKFVDGAKAILASKQLMNSDGRISRTNVTEVLEQLEAFKYEHRLEMKSVDKTFIQRLIKSVYSILTSIALYSKLKTQFQNGLNVDDTATNFISGTTLPNKLKLSNDEILRPLAENIFDASLFLLSPAARLEMEERLPR